MAEGPPREALDSPFGVLSQVKLNWTWLRRVALREKVAGSSRESDGGVKVEEEREGKKDILGGEVEVCSVLDNRKERLWDILVAKIVC